MAIINLSGSANLNGDGLATQTDITNTQTLATAAVAGEATSRTSAIAAEATARTAAIAAAIAALPTFYPVMPFLAISSSRAVLSTDYFIKATSAGGVPTFPTAVGIKGQSYIFKNSSGGNITPLTTSSQTIDGSTPAVLANLGVLRIVSDNANWLTW